MLRIAYCVTFLLIALVPDLSHAQDYQLLQNDLKQASGTLILESRGQYIIDLDANAGVNVGDILALVAPGKILLAKGLGSGDLTIGYLQVMAVKSGYSYTRHIKGKVEPKEGYQVVRFKQVPAQLISTTIDVERFKSALSNFNWVDSDSPKAPLLKFVEEGEQLSIVDAQGSVLYEYRIEGNGISALYKADQPNTLDEIIEKKPSVIESIYNNTLDRVL